MVKTAVRRAVPVLPGTHRHQPRLHAPWFAPQEGTSVHRYLDDQFVPRFLQDAAAARLGATKSQDWYRKDRFGRHQDYPALRLPMHRAFHIACCEVSCETFGLPAFDPAKVVSAGFVIRRRPMDGSVERWMVQDGVALGWQGGPIPGLDPSQYRRMVNRGLSPPKEQDPAYTGEESYPLHAVLVQAKSADGHSRNHTLLWGYIPLGGSFRSTPDTSLTAGADSALSRELPWPYGTTSTETWDDADGAAVQDGHASEGFRQLLSSLLARYRITEDTDDNQPLRDYLDKLHFQLERKEARRVKGKTVYVTVQDQGESLLDWFAANTEGILDWLAALDSGKATTADLALPRRTTYDEDGNAGISAREDDLLISEQQAEDLRELLLHRVGRAIALSEDGLALPRFGQADDDRFVIVPFVRWIDVCGCERCTWGKDSPRFRVASPLEAAAQRPHAVVLPDLDDLKRGSPAGVTFMLPKKLADVIRRIAPSIKLLDDKGPGNPAGLCWSFGFSIPIITICAMILLMIVINILNLFFRWLPWAFLALPRLCLKCLKP